MIDVVKDCLQVLVVTSQWPTDENPAAVPFLVREVAALRSLGCKVDVFHYKGGFRPDRYIKALRHLRRQLHEKHYDLIHGQFGVGGILALGVPKIPLIVTFQGSDLNGIHDLEGRLTLRGFLLRKVSQAIATFADEVILVSEEMSRFVQFRNYHVIPGGIDFTIFKPYDKKISRQRLNIPLDRHVILFAGDKTNPIKRFHLAYQAVELLGDQYNAEILVTNGVCPDDMPYYLSAVDALLLTSSREGSPNIVKEALACNCRVVSLNVGDVQRWIGNIPGCAISNDDSPNAIAHALATAMEYSNDFNGREIIECLDIRVIARNIIKVYRQALS